MKRKLLLMLTAFLLIPWIGNAQITTFPYTEGFEGTFPPNGWKKVLGDPASSNVVGTSYYSNHTAGGKYSCYFTNYNPASDYNEYLFTDTIHVTSGYTRLTFWQTKYNGAPENLEWGISTTTQSVAAVSKWTAVPQLSLSDTKWQETTVDLSAYVGKTIFFVWHYYGHNYFVWIDDVVIDKPPSSSCSDPSGLTLNKITTSSARLGWTENGTAASWDIELRKFGVTPEEKPTQTGVTNKPYTYTGLSGNTQYYWYVRANCGAGSYSNWVGPGTFTTPAPVQNYPFTEDWENGLNGTKWSWYHGLFKSTIKTSTASKHNGTYGLEQYGFNQGSRNRFYTDPSSLADAYTKAQPGGTNTDWTTWSEISVDLSSASNPLLTFWYSMYYTSDYWNNFWVQVSTDGTTWTDLFSTQTNGSTIAYERKQFDLSAYKGKTLYIRFFHNGNENYDYLYLDDISVAENSCPDPSAQTVNNIMSSSAELGWSETGSATTWDIELGAKGFTPAGVPTKTGVTNPYTYPGLSGNTQYDWYVRASCSGGGHSNWLGANTFTTAQAVAPVQNLPFSEDWENGLSDTKLNWYSGSVSTIQTSTASKHTGTYGLEQYGNGGSYTTPTGWAGAYTKAQPGGVNANSTSWIKMHVDLTNATNPWLTFWYAMGFIYVDFDNNLWVQVSTDGTTWTDLFKAKTNGADVAYMKKQLDLSTYKGKKIYIRFFHNGAVNSNYLYLDDISVANISCPDPSAQTVSTTTSSASLGWTEKGSATTWDIELGAKGFTPAGVPTKTGVTSNPYTYPGLSTITSYDWYVRAVCGGGSYSSWVGPGTFSTKNNPVNPPYFQDFDNVTPPAFPGSMTVENTNGDAQTWHTTTSPHNSYPNSAEIDNNYTSPTVAKNDWFFTRGLNLTGGVTYEVNFVYLSGNGTEKLAVDWGADASSTAMSGTPVFDNANIRTNATWKIGSGTFTPSTTGAYYVGFHAYSDAGEDRIRVDDIQIVQYQQTATWTGTTDNDWTKGSNWSTGSPPGASTDVIIPPGKSNYPILTKTAYIKNLTIRSTATGDGALIGANHIMASGTETVQRYLTGGLWHYVSATTSGATVNSFYFNNNPDVWMDEFNEAHNSWTPVTSLTTAMPPGKGFEVWVKSGKSVTAAFTGTINSGNVLLTWSFTNAAHGYNLIGNPFSSAIDWHDIYQDIHQNSDDQVWEWNGSTYLDYVDGSKLGSLASGIIPIGQGFFVHATSAANVYINSNVQYSSSHKFYKSSGGDVLPHFVLLAEKGERKDEVWIAFHKGSTTAFENGFDGRKMIATQKGAAPQIYTKEGNNFLSIDCLPPVDDNSRTISLYFKANENGEQTIVAHDFDLVPGLSVVLEDTKLNVLQNLNNHPVYTFSADTAQDPARFLLHLNRSVNGIKKHAMMNVNTWANDHYLYISIAADVSNVKKKLLVYDLLGRKMIEETLPSGELIKIPLLLSNSWVVVKIISPGKVYTNKVFVR